MAVNVKTDMTLTRYSRGLYPQTLEGLHPFLQNELLRIDNFANEVSESGITVADNPPTNPKKGMVRYAVDPWFPLSHITSGDTKLVVYNGTAWVEVSNTGSPTATTQSAGDNTTKVATTAFVQGEKASPTFTGTPLSTTASSGTNTTQIATTAFVQGEKASPTFTGTPLAPTASSGTNTTQIATTAFVKAHTDSLVGLSDIAQTWRVQTNKMGNQEPLNDFAVANDAAYGSLGTTMGYTNSTGVFKFPEKGFYVAFFQISMRLEAGEVEVFARIQCDTQNGSGFTEISQTQLGNSDTTATRGAGSAFALFDVKDSADVSNFEVRFVVNSITVNTGNESTSTAVDGSANQNITSVTFVKIANS
jgi:hypothetical protein